MSQSVQIPDNITFHPSLHVIVWFVVGIVLLRDSINPSLLVITGLQHTWQCHQPSSYVELPTGTLRWTASN